MLHIDSVVKKIQNKVILNDIAFSVNKNEILGLFGRNGSGKTTLFNCILNIENPDFIYRKYNGEVLKNNQLSKLFSYSSQEIFIPDNIYILDK